MNTLVDTPATQNLEPFKGVKKVPYEEDYPVGFLKSTFGLEQQAEGDYVSLQHGRHPYLLRGSLSAIGEILKPYGFIRIHRSVVVNASLVEEIEPLSTGEYKLRVKGGQESMVTRTYRGNLRFVAHLWLGANVFVADPSSK